MTPAEVTGLAAARDGQDDHPDSGHDRRKKRGARHRAKIPIARRKQTRDQRCVDWRRGERLMEIDYRNDIERVSAEALDVLEVIATSADAELSQPSLDRVGALASINTLTSGGALKTLNGIGDARHRSLMAASQEPAIARVVVRTDDGVTLVYYICRETAPIVLEKGKKLAGRNTPAGRLASLRVGDDFEIVTPGGVIAGEILERALLYPGRKDGAWDSFDTVLFGGSYGTVTLKSLREALAGTPLADFADDLLAGILSEDEKASNVTAGIRRSVIVKMGLRDQPILDRYQDEIFRLPLNSQLLIVGPPGTGKTTTLIRRLGQKLDLEHLDDAERRLAEATRSDGSPLHRDSWMMFTPTDLLKQYLKEAFAREHIAASDQKIQTWSRFRLDLARNRFRLLKASNGGGPFVLKEGQSFTQPSTLEDQTAWFEDFAAWQDEAFRAELKAASDQLALSQQAEARSLSSSLAAIVARADVDNLAETMTALVKERDAMERLLKTLKDGTDAAIRRSLNLQINRNRSFLEELATFTDGLAIIDQDDGEDADTDEEEAPVGASSRGRLAAAVTDYERTLRSQARTRVSRRSLGASTRAGKLAEWIGDRSLQDDELRLIGESLQTQAALRRFANPIRRYIHGVAGRYRRFRRIRQTEGRWYVVEGIAANDCDPLETDVMLLCIMRTASSLLRARSIRRDLDDPAYAPLRDYAGLLRNQIVVDEATDFSPVQLACMGAMATPEIQSFFACGDFNQRLTRWGSRSTTDMKWAFPRIAVRPIQVTYRHSRQLNHLASEIVRLCSGETVDVALPEDVNNEGVAPVLGVDLERRDDVIDWLARRIVEIEGFTKPLPSVAVLVNDEADVGPIADGLQAALAGQNLSVVACYKGQFGGQENDIRVFDVQHIKGLEFEAVFFVGVDRLATMHPELFDKYLYVGATRAATYLGITCYGPALPDGIGSLLEAFRSNWRP
jgi:hypothetical protein